MEAEDVKPPMVRDAVAAYYAGHRLAGTEPETRTAQIYFHVFRALGVKRGAQPRYDVFTRRIEANIRSALNRMADAGTLHVIAGSASNLYLTPEQYQRRAAAEAEVSQHKALRKARTERVKAELEELGLTPEQGDGAIRLPLGDWEELAALARNGKALIR